MPPWRQWFLGRDGIRAFFGWAWTFGKYGGFRLVPTAANRQPGFAMYSRGRKGPEWRAHSIHLLTLQDESIAALTIFVGPQLFAAFGLPAVPPTQDGAAPSRLGRDRGTR